jgi:RNA polymerase sigma factor (sigma-70 family)
MNHAEMKDRLLELVPALRRFAYSLSNSVHDADDLLQNTVERLLTRPMPEDASLEKWAYTVCRNLWIDECRSRKVRAAVSFEPDLHDVVSIEGEKDMVLKIELEQINTAMRELPEDQHIVLSMVAVQGLSYKEVAEALQIPQGTVMSRLARARARLAELVTPAGSQTPYTLH